MISVGIGWNERQPAYEQVDAYSTRNACESNSLRQTWVSKVVTSQKTPKW